VSITVTATDGLHGRPAAGIEIQLERRDDDGWRERACGRADAGGQVRQWQPDGGLERGTYRVELDLDGYFAALGVVPFLPVATVTFRLPDAAEPCHIAVVITPAASAAYRVR
jgi:5-hydroxyisourate hydrolase